MISNLVKKKIVIINEKHTLRKVRVKEKRREPYFEAKKLWRHACIINNITVSLKDMI